MMVSVYVVLRTGTVGLAVTGVMIVIFQYLVGELLTSKRRGYRLAQIATTDELTGVANRERFQARLEQEIALARDSGGSFPVMLLDQDLPRQIEERLRRHDLPPRALRVEITESMIMADPDRSLQTVLALSALGVHVSIDDFGTGYSSLSMLKRLPVDELKIDRSFVSPMMHDESDLIIVRSTIHLGHDLGMKVIAEGVEDQGTLDRLASLGCDLIQSYHVSRPLPADAFTHWLIDRLGSPGHGEGDAGQPLQAG
jgi:predicted signal transduction protein with EAL and GGDEF domain